MLKKMPIQVIVIALLFAISTNFYAAEKNIELSGMQGSTPQLSLPQLRPQAHTPVTLPEDRLVLFVEQLNLEQALSTIAQRYPHITRIVLDRMEDQTQLSPEQVTLLQFKFPKLTHIELPSNLLTDINHAHIQKLFPELKLIIQKSAPETSTEAPRTSKRSRAELEKGTSEVQEKTEVKEQEQEEVKQKSKKRRSSAGSTLTTTTATTSSASTSTLAPARSKSESALASFSKTLLDAPRKILRAIRKDSKTSSTSTSSTPFDFFAATRQDINRMLEQIEQERNSGLVDSAGNRFEDVPVEVRNYTIDVLGELIEALQAATRIVDHAQANATSPEEFNGVIANLERAYKGLARMKKEFEYDVHADYIPTLANSIVQIVRAFNSLAGFTRTSEALERLESLSRELSGYR